MSISSRNCKKAVEAGRERQKDKGDSAESIALKSCM